MAVEALSRDAVFIAAAVIFTVALAVSVWRGIRRARPLGTLLETASRLESGDLAARAGIAAEDEFGELGSAIDSLATNMEHHAARTAAIVASIHEGLIAVDENRIVDTFNPAAERLLGLSALEAVGRPIEDVFEDAGAPADPWCFERVSLRGEPARAVAITGSPIEGAGTVFVVRDMTKEQQLDRMKIELLSNISHELRTPLTPIVGYSEMLTRQSFPPAQTRGFAVSILEAARNLERVTDRLVAFAAIEGGMYDKLTEPVDPQAIARQASERWNHGRHQTIDVRTAARVPVIRGNRQMLMRALEELVENAVKFSPAGSHVSVSASAAGSGSDRVVRLSVRDEGIGIRADQLQDVREAFRQADGSAQRAFGGLGLGLTLADRIVRLHGGSLVVTSRPGKGSVFSMVLPAPAGRGATGGSSAD